MNLASLVFIAVLIAALCYVTNDKDDFTNIFSSGNKQTENKETENKELEDDIEILPEDIEELLKEYYDELASAPGDEELKEKIKTTEILLFRMKIADVEDILMDKNDDKEEELMNEFGNRCFEGKCKEYIDRITMTLRNL